MHSALVFRNLQDDFLCSDRRLQEKQINNIQLLIEIGREKASNSLSQTEGYKEEQDYDKEFLNWDLEELVNERYKIQHLTAENRQLEEEVRRPETHLAPTIRTTMFAPMPIPTPTPAPIPTSRPVPRPTSTPFAPIPTPTFIPRA